MDITIMGNQQLSARFYLFALNVISLVEQLPRGAAGGEIGRQLFAAAAAVNTAYEGARVAPSRDEFTAMMCQSFKQAREAHLWLNMLKDSRLCTGKELEGLLTEATAIRNILAKSVKTARSHNAGMKKA
jgi:four helix bundle protein